MPEIGRKVDDADFFALSWIIHANARSNQLVHSGAGTMAAYIFASVEISDPAAYEEYRRRVPTIIAEYGGRYLVRGGAVERLEGDAPLNRLIILEFPDMARLKAFYNSAQYQPLLAMRQRAAISTLLAIEGV